MISAITNPFLYSYFNETFKNGLERIYSSCCLQMNREVNQISFNQTEYSVNQIKLLDRHPSSILLNGDSNSKISTKVTMISSN